MQLTAERLAEMSSRGPRYTSYPPATEFAALDPEVVDRELDTMRRHPTAGSLYVHVPFCRSLCAYCGCNVIPTRDVSKGERYIDALATEAAILAGKLGSAYPVAEIAIGGGSPNFLSPRSLRTLMTSLLRSFAVADDARLSVELDPRDTTFAQVDAFAAAGFRALSVGIQDFSPDVQDAIRRHQTIAQTGWLIERARKAGFTDINADIVYGLPRQNEASFAATLDAVIGLGPERIALFGYAHLPDRLPHQRLVERAGRVLDRYERAQLLLLAIEQLSRAGYLRLGLDHFAKPGSALAHAAAGGRMTRTFQGYVERKADAILGLGVSAISSTPHVFWQNHPDLASYERALAAAELPITRGKALDGDDEVRRALIEHLMCNGEVDLEQLGERYAIDAETYFATELGSLVRQPELAVYDAEARVIRTTELGTLLVRNVCMLFDRYDHAAGRFSMTV